MYLKRLEIAGFKSFAKKTELVFDTPITSIVGPNGSGKSNVAEAFRWVLGEQSMKSLRGKRGEDLIYAGPGGNLNRASVTVVFDNSSRKFDIDFDEVIITREVFRDGTNDYKINGSSVRLKDIIELLSAVSLGPSGHHIISQGEADRILSANMFERRTMIEEALGLKIYQWKILESEKKLTKTNDNIKQVESLQREIAPHIKFLKKQVEKIEKADEMRRELKALYREYFAYERLYLEETKARLSVAGNGPKQELEAVELKLSELEATLSRAAAENPKIQELAETERALREVRNAKDELGRKLGRLEGMLEIQTDRANRQASEEDSRVVSLRHVEGTLHDIDARMAEAESASDFDTVRSLVSRVREAIRTFFNSHEHAAPEANLESELENLRLEISDIERELAQKQQAETEYFSRQQSLKTAIEADREATRGAERELFELRTTRSELRSKLEALRAEEEKYRLLEADYERELHEAAALTDREVIDFPHELHEGVDLSVDRGVQEDRRRQIERLKIRLEDMGVEGTDVMEEYKKATEREEFLVRELSDLIAASESLRQVIADLQLRLDTEFKQGIHKINSRFQEFFALMFGGGNASLEVIAEQKKKRKDTDLSGALGDDMEIPEEGEEEGKEGIDITVNLPRKKIKGLQMLSGGERALTSIALLFAMSQVNPPPFLILDETDAALDEANSRKYGDMVAALSEHSQLIVITHNRETMSRAGVLYGVTMGGDGVSKLLSIKFDDASVYAK